MFDQPSTFYSADYLDHQPNEFSSSIFKNLNLDQILKMRFLSDNKNSSVKSYVNQLEISELSSRTQGPYKSLYYPSLQSTSLNNQVHYSNVYFLLEHLPNDKLKFLKLQLSPKANFEIGALRKFENLDTLYVENCLVRSNVRLQLKKLKVFCCTYTIDISCKLTLDTPELSMFSFINYTGKSLTEYFEFTDPSTITRLRLKTYENGASIFSNLKVLELMQLNCQINFIKDQHDSNDIKSVKFPSTFPISNVSNYWESTDHLLLNDLDKFYSLEKLLIYEVYINFGELREIFRKRKLEVFVKGVHIIREDQIDDYAKMKVNEFLYTFHTNNHQNLQENLCFVKHFHHHELRYLIKSSFEIYRDFILLRKYTHIQKVSISEYVRKYVREDQCINLLQILKPSLMCLEVLLKLSQHFFDQLPALNLIELQIDPNISDLTSNYQLNFNFIMKMRYLTKFYIYDDFLTDSDLDLNALAYLEEFGFQMNDEKILVCKLENRYIVTLANSVSKDNYFKNLNEAIEWLDDRR